jgi:hypothetical protein
MNPCVKRLAMKNIELMGAGSGGVEELLIGVAMSTAISDVANLGVSGSGVLEPGLCGGV